MQPDLEIEKAALRKQAARHRSSLMAENPLAGDNLIHQLEVVMQRCGNGIYAAYLPIHSELSPLPLVAALADLGIVTALPVTPPPGNPLTFYRWAPGMRLDDGPYNTKQPPLSGESVIPDVILHQCWPLMRGAGGLVMVEVFMTAASLACAKQDMKLW